MGVGCRHDQRRSGLASGRSWNRLGALDHLRSGVGRSSMKTRGD